MFFCCGLLVVHAAIITGAKATIMVTSFGEAAFFILSPYFFLDRTNSLGSVVTMLRVEKGSTKGRVQFSYSAAEPKGRSDFRSISKRIFAPSPSRFQRSLMSLFSYRRIRHPGRHRPQRIETSCL